MPWGIPGDDAVRWCAAPKEGSLAWRLREDGGDVVRTTSLKDLGVLPSAIDNLRIIYGYLWFIYG